MEGGRARAHPTATSEETPMSPHLGRSVILPASLAAFLVLGPAPRASAAGGGAASALPPVRAAGIGGVSPSANSGGITACDVTLSDSGSVSSVAIVQDVAPYGAALAAALPSWRFEAARQQGGAGGGPGLVLRLGRPPPPPLPPPPPPRSKGAGGPAPPPRPPA